MLKLEVFVDRYRVAPAPNTSQLLNFLCLVDDSSSEGHLSKVPEGFLSKVLTIKEIMTRGHQAVS